MTTQATRLQVPFVDLRRQHDPLMPVLRQAFDRVVAANAFILGPEVEAFEHDFAAFCGVGDAVGVSSGTAALSLALRAAGVGPGDEVIVPAHTFIATALGAIHAGATPVLCDVDDATALIDPASAAACIGPRTRAIIGVHLYGQCCDMTALREIAVAHDLVLVEDAAQAHGATLGGSRAGSLGDLACFSFYPSKNLGALGDGGMVTTGDPMLAERLRFLRDLGQLGKGNHVEVGYNERLDGLQAALLATKLPLIDGWNAARREHAARLRELLPGSLQVVAERPESPSVNHVFAVRHPERDRLRARLGELGVATGVHYTPALPEHPAFADGVVADRTDLSTSRAWAREELSLPMFAELTAAETKAVADACHAALEV